MFRGRASGDVKRVGDLPIGATLGEQAQHVAFAGGETGDAAGTVAVSERGSRLVEQLGDPIAAGGTRPIRSTRLRAWPK